MRQPASGMWQLERSDESGASDAESHSILKQFAEHAFPSTSHDPGIFQGHGSTSPFTGVIGTPSINIDDTGSWCSRRFVAHHRSSVLSEYNCSLLDFIQAATLLMHPDISDDNVFTAAGKHEP